METNPGMHRDDGPLAAVRPASARPVPDMLGPAAAGARPVIDPPRRSETLVPFFAVGIVATAGLAAALMAARPDPAPPAEQAAQAPSNEVVQAPPLAGKVPVGATAGSTQPRASTSAMGAAPACGNCGVVQMVVAVHGYAQPRASGYQMHIRMDDGTTRTVQQRGALPAGSRVQVDGDSVRVLALRSRQG
jgi:hypothetical protein